LVVVKKKSKLLRIEVFMDFGSYARYAISKTWRRLTGTRPRMTILSKLPDTNTGGINFRSEMDSMFDSSTLDYSWVYGDVTTKEFVASVDRNLHQIVHVCSHARRDGLELSRGEVVGAGWIARVLRDRGVRVLLLNACETHDIGDVVYSAGIDAVITTLDKVSDSEAISFAGSFYRMLERTQSVKTSFDYSVLAAGSSSWARYNLVGDYFFF